MDKEKMVCALCKCTFQKKNSLYQHIKRKHPSDICNKQRKAQTCPLCKFDGSKQQLLQHFTDVHKVDIEIEYLFFSNFQEIKEWMEKMQQEMKTQFVLRSSLAGPSSVDVARHYYVCSRSGKYSSRSKGLRKVRLQGTKKINGFCPAEITCVQGANSWSVKFVKTHIGHENEVRHLRLTACQRKTIADKISANIPFVEIIGQIQHSIVNAVGLERLHLLTMLDLHNVKKSYNLTCTVAKNLNDLESLDAWVHELELTGDSFVLIHKPQGLVDEHYPYLTADDFVLAIMNRAQSEVLEKFGSDCVCIDEVQGPNEHGFYLTTLLVVDNLRQSFPCAFLISNRRDEPIMKAFFINLRESVGKIVPDLFVSASDSTFNAWVDIMDAVKHRLFCSWQVDRVWRDHLLQSIPNKSMQEEVYQQIHALLEENDKEAFVDLRRNIENKLLNNSYTASLGTYLSDNYFHCNVECWASYYSAQCGFSQDIQTRIERMHKTLEYIFLNGRNVTRLDKCVYALVRLVRDKVIDRLVVMNRSKVSSKLKDVKKRHRAMVEDCEMARSVAGKNGGWLVKASKGNKSYYVYRVVQDCQCQLLCAQCSACIHLYTCSCPDSSLRWNMCKHIHAVCTFLLRSEDQPCLIVRQEDLDVVMEVDSVYEEVEISMEEPVESTAEVVMNGVEPAEVEVATKDVELVEMQEVTEDVDPLEIEVVPYTEPPGREVMMEDVESAATEVVEEVVEVVEEVAEVKEEVAEVVEEVAEVVEEVAEVVEEVAEVVEEVAEVVEEVAEVVDEVVEPTLTLADELENIKQCLMKKFSSVLDSMTLDEIPLVENMLDSLVAQRNASENSTSSLTNNVPTDQDKNVQCGTSSGKQETKSYLLVTKQGESGKELIALEITNSPKGLQS